MKVEPDVSLELLTLTDVIGHEHEMIAMDPNSLRVHQLADLVNATRHSCIHCLKLGPVVDRCLRMVGRRRKVVHVWPHNLFVEAQIGNNLFLGKVDCVAILLSKHLTGLLLLNLCHGVLCDNNADPDKVISLGLCKLVQVGEEKGW